MDDKPDGWTYRIERTGTTKLPYEVAFGYNGGFVPVAAFRNDRTAKAFADAFAKDAARPVAAGDGSDVEPDPEEAAAQLEFEFMK